MCRSILACLSFRMQPFADYPEGTKEERRRLKKIFKELGARCGESQTSIDKDAFLKYIDLPGLIGEQFFSAIDEDENDKLSVKEFIGAMLCLYKGSFESVSWLFFKMLDFNQNGYVIKDDMTYILAHLPRKCSRCHKLLMITLDTDEIIVDFFREVPKMHFIQFKDQLQVHPELCEIVLNCIFNGLPAILDEIFLPQSLLSSLYQEVHAGWLNYKQRPYYFQLKNQSLYYSPLEEAISNPTGIILIRDLFVEPVGSKSFVLKNTFFEYKFITSSQEETNLWVSKVKVATNFRDIDDHYTFGKKIGKGGFGKVNLGTNKETGNHVAIKTIPKEPLDPHSEARLRREINILNLCRDEHMLRLEAIFETSTHMYIVTDYVAGGTLYTWLKHHNFKIPENLAKRIIKHITKALIYLHSLGIIHRDLKLENILFAFDEAGNITAKLIDFGLSCILGPEQYSNESWGTLMYASPELINKDMYRESVDIWGLGVISHILLTGNLPFYGSTDNAIAEKVLNKEIDTNTREWNNVSEEGKYIVKSLLNKNPSDRISLTDLLEDEWFEETFENVEVHLPTIDRKKNPFEDR